MSDGLQLNNVMKQYPYLWPFLFSPGYLDIIAKTRDYKCGYELKTMTGLILKKLLMRAHDPSIGRKYVSVVDKVKKLTYYNLTKRQWFTREQELPENGLTESDVVSTGIMLPMTKPSCTLDYCCRFEQEFYAGCYVLHMDKDEFLEFATEHASQEFFMISTAVACGLLFDEVVRRKFRALGKTPQLHLEYKRKVMADFFVREFEEKSRTNDLYTMMFEGQQGMKNIITRNVRGVRTDGFVSPLYQVLANSYVIQQSANLEEASFVSCGMNEKKVNLLHQYVSTSDVKCSVLDVSQNDALNAECMYLLAKCVARFRCKVFLANGCQLTPTHIKRFAAGLGNGKFDILHVNNNESLGEEGMYHLGKLVGNAMVDKIFVKDCKLGEKEWKKFSEGVADAEAASGPKFRLPSDKTELLFCQDYETHNEKTTKGGPNVVKLCV